MTELKFKLNKIGNTIELNCSSDIGDQTILSFDSDKKLKIYTVYIRSMSAKVIDIRDRNVKIIDGHGNIIREGRE